MLYTQWSDRVRLVLLFYKSFNLFWMSYILILNIFWLSSGICFIQALNLVAIAEVLLVDRRNANKNFYPTDTSTVLFLCTLCFAFFSCIGANLNVLNHDFESSMWQNWKS